MKKQLLALIAQFKAKTIGKGVYTETVSETPNVDFTVSEHDWPSGESVLVADLGDFQCQFRGKSEVINALQIGQQSKGTFIIARSPNGSQGDYPVAPGECKAYMRI